MTHSFLPLVDVCDNFKLSALASSSLPASFCLSSDAKSAVGLVFPDVVDALRDENVRNAESGKPESWVLLKEDGSPSTMRNEQVRRVHFAGHLNTPETRSKAIGDVCWRWHNDGLFAEVIGGRLWRAELYPIYKNPFAPHGSVEVGFTNKVFEMERAACALFGVVQYGVHLTIYYPEVKGADNEVKEEMKIWVPTRSKTKQTWPGMLDNSVAGGITAGMLPFDSLVKESMEEASLPEDIIRRHAKSAGAISYFFRTAKGYLQPEVQYVYDLAVPSSLKPEEQELFRPKPLDGEVEAFELLPLSEVLTRMHKGLFKPNCALVNIDFLIRHGYITPESEPHFLGVLTRLHGRFELERW